MRETYFLICLFLNTNFFSIFIFQRIYSRLEYSYYNPVEDYPSHSKIVKRDLVMLAKYDDDNLSGKWKHFY